MDFYFSYKWLYTDAYYNNGSHLFLVLCQWLLSHSWAGSESQLGRYAAMALYYKQSGELLPERRVIIGADIKSFDFGFLEEDGKWVTFLQVPHMQLSLEKLLDL